MNKVYLADNELVDKFVSGDMNSLELLINRYRKQVYTYILLLVKNQHLAEDLFQDTFIKVIKSLDGGKYRDNGKFLAWVLRECYVRLQILGKNYFILFSQSIL